MKIAQVFTNALVTSGLIVGTNAAACYDYRTDSCSCDNVRCDPDICESELGLLWSEDCPTSCEMDCDPLRATDTDPSCTGAPELVDRFGKRMYRRKLIARDIPADGAESGTFCALTFELCPGESSITQNFDAGNSDYYRIAATAELAENWRGEGDYKYSEMHKPTGARSYSPTNPANANNLQFILKMVRSDPVTNECTPGVDCQFGLTELACEAPIGSYFLLSKELDIGESAVGSSHAPMYSTIDPTPGAGPYTINMIGQGVALTELNIVAMSDLLHPFASDGSFSTVKEINYLWANSYYSSSEWVWNKLDVDDLARQFKLTMGKYGIRFNLMHSISREDRPEAEWPRVDVNVIGDAFKLTNTTKQDPNIKWIVVGSSGYKKAIYPQILEWGFDMHVLSYAGSKGYPYVGPNSLHMNVPAGEDPNKRPRSELFQAYAKGEDPVFGMGK